MFVEKILKKIYSKHNYKRDIFCSYCDSMFACKRIVNYHYWACNECLKETGGFLIETRTVHTSEYTTEECSSTISFFITNKILANRNVLTEKHRNTINDSLIRIAIKNDAKFVVSP